MVATPKAEPAVLKHRKVRARLDDLLVATVRTIDAIES
jgi:hypothetical protein